MKILKWLMFSFTLFTLAQAAYACPEICDRCIGSTEYGGPCYAGYGGPRYDGYGGACYAGYGGACDSTYGGACYAGYGGPCDTSFGGACAPESTTCPDICTTSCK